jgi:hypothetical protein
MEQEGAMTAFDGARDMDSEEAPPLNIEWLSRVAEIDGSWWLAPEPIRRRHLGQAVARWIVAAAIATAAAWIFSDWAVAALLDEGRLAAIGIV